MNRRLSIILVAVLALMALTTAVASAQSTSDVRPGEWGDDHTVTVKAFIDGRSRLHVYGSNFKSYWAFRWQHFEKAAPGRHSSAPNGNAPTYVNGQARWSIWPHDPTYIYFNPSAPVNNEERNCYCWAKSSVSFKANVNRTDRIFGSMNVVTGRGAVRLIQSANKSNGYVTIVEFDDLAPAGPAWYEIQLNY